MIYLQLSESLSEDIPALLKDLSFLERAGLETLRQAGDRPSDLSIVITGDDQLQELNRQYLGIDAPTDVLAFPADEDDPDSGVRYLGDVLISYPRAAAQANSRGHPIQDELQLLVVHGVLHLLGHNHAEPAEKARMWHIQAQVLGSIGSQLSAPSD